MIALRSPKAMKMVAGATGPSRPGRRPGLRSLWSGVIFESVPDG